VKRYIVKSVNQRVTSIKIIDVNISETLLVSNILLP
jgi:hypothetical protein